MKLMSMSTSITGKNITILLHYMVLLPAHICEACNLSFQQER